MTEIILINGSTKRHSKTSVLISILDKYFQNFGYETKIINIADLNLKVFDPCGEVPNSIKDIWDDLIHAKAFIVGSPEYHGGYSGGIKNFIDHLNSDVFYKKPLGLVASTGGQKTGANTLNGLRLVFRSLYSNVIPEQVSISDDEYINGKMDENNIKKLLTVGHGIHTHFNAKQKMHT